MARAKRYAVHLTATQQQHLETLTRTGKERARVITRARILLLSAAGKTDQAISDALQVCLLTVHRTRKSFVTEGLEAALYDAARTGRPVKFDGQDRAAITSLACTKAPKGHAKWSIRLLADKAVELNVVDGIAPSTVYYILKKQAATAP